MTTQLDRFTPLHTDTGADVLTVTLTDEEKRAVRQLTGALTADKRALIDSPEWIDRARALSCRLPLSLRSALRRFRREPGPEAVLLVRNLPLGPLPPTPSNPGSVEHHPSTPAAALFLTTVHIGDVTAFRPEKGGALVQNVVPVPGQEDFQGNAGSVALKMHVENAFHQHRPDYVALLCLRNDHDDIAGLRTSSIRRALPLLSEHALAVLSQPRFVTNAPPSFGNSVPAAEPQPILLGDLEDPDVVVDFHATDPLDVEAAAALDELGHAFDHVTRTFILRSGDLAIVDNRLAMHGRTAFRPRYDGQDRWLQRTFVHLDPRRTRPLRSGDGNVLS